MTSFIVITLSFIGFLVVGLLYIFFKDYIDSFIKKQIRLVRRKGQLFKTRRDKAITLRNQMKSIQKAIEIDRGIEDKYPCIFSVEIGGKSKFQSKPYIFPKDGMPGKARAFYECLNHIQELFFAYERDWKNNREYDIRNIYIERYAIVPDYGTKTKLSGLQYEPCFPETPQEYFEKYHEDYFLVDFEYVPNQIINREQADKMSWEQVMHLCLPKNLNRGF